MRTITLAAPGRQVAELLDAALREPITVLRDGEPGVVVLSVAEYQRRQSQAWQQLLDTLSATSVHARQQGLTDAELERLLADES
jgi:prevent-host-death family protein